MTELFKISDAGSYDSLTDRFDVLSERYTADVAESVAAAVMGSRPRRVLDVGSGSGLLTRRLRADSVIGVDLSVGMLATAATHVPSAAFARMDAENPAFRTAAFDAVVSLFALLHLPDPLACITECRRILKPGGRLTLGYGAGPPALSGMGVRRASHAALAALKSGLRRPLGAPRTLDGVIEEMTGPRSSEITRIAGTGGGARGRAVLEMIRKAGFVDVRTTWSGSYFVISTIEEFWEVQAVFSSFARKRLAAASPDLRAAIRKTFFERCRRAVDRGVRMVYPCGAAVVSARRP